MADNSLEESFATDEDFALLVAFDELFAIDDFAVEEFVLELSIDELFVLDDFFVEDFVLLAPIDELFALDDFTLSEEPFSLLKLDLATELLAGRSPPR